MFLQEQSLAVLWHLILEVVLTKLRFLIKLSVLSDIVILVVTRKYC